MGNTNISEHDVKFFVGVEEVASSWTYHYACLDVYTGTYFCYGTHGGCDASFCRGGAQLHTVYSKTCGCVACIKGVGAEFTFHGDNVYDLAVKVAINLHNMTN
jgi:hypothetical protein